MTDPTITIAGLEARIKCLVAALRTANTGRAEAATLDSAACGYNAQLRTERDALAAQLAEVRAKLDAAPKVCAIHSYEHGPGPCMTCGAWPPGTRELIAACQTRIAGLEQAADERSAEVARLTARVAELEARPVLTEERLRGALFACADGASDAEVRAILAALGPVTLPAQDRAEELVSAWRGICTDSATCDLDPAERMRRALASLGAPPTSPPAARPVFAWVSEEELALEYARAVDRIPGIRAVLARLEVSLVAPVDPEVVARRYHDHKESPVPEWPYAADHDINSPIGADHEQARLRATAAMRATLTAAGIPVTPEVGK